MAAVVASVLAVAGCSSTVAGDPVAPRTPATSQVTPPSAGPSTPPPVQGAAFTDPQTVEDVLSDARADIVATNTYDYRHLAEYRTTALAATTGDFTRTLTETIDSLIAVNAPKLHAAQRAQVDRIGIADLSGGDA
ncbi:MAG: hypothetical protein QOJ34_2110, partial [Pseudonocardiales bacterium]|nr:hypothetical protein [Pseudonocardiales bacterium]